MQDEGIVICIYAYTYHLIPWRSYCHSFLQPPHPSPMILPLLLPSATYLHKHWSVPIEMNSCCMIKSPSSLLLCESNDVVSVSLGLLDDSSGHPSLHPSLIRPVNLLRVISTRMWLLIKTSRISILACDVLLIYMLFLLPGLIRMASPCWNIDDPYHPSLIVPGSNSNR